MCTVTPKRGSKALRGTIYVHGCIVEFLMKVECYLKTNTGHYYYGLLPHCHGRFSLNRGPHRPGDRPVAFIDTAVG